MDYGTFCSFWLVSLLLVITPGLDWAFVMSAGMLGRTVVPAVSGLLLGHLTAILLVAAGVGALVARTPGALTVLTFAGAAYLLWIGICQVRHPPGPPAPGETEGVQSGFQWAVKGAFVSGLNPKVLLLFLVLLPQFVDRTSPWPVPLQIVALGALHIFTCGAVYLAVGFSTRALLRARQGAARMVSRISGAAMIVIALLLLIEHTKH